MHQLFSLARDVGWGVAWLIGIACGWRVAQHADLLDAVLRGTAGGLAVLTLWMAGIFVCKQFITGGNRRSDEHDGA
jgi:hypothetical protein